MTSNLIKGVQKLRSKGSIFSKEKNQKVVLEAHKMFCSPSNTKRIYHKALGC